MCSAARYKNNDCDSDDSGRPIESGYRFKMTTHTVTGIRDTSRKITGYVTGPYDMDQAENSVLSVN
ncbi:uncharacterized protein N7515_000283 [Penicillium bovifimosum]|uniref:Uncharacterized protein n=1 Tax=Penicillium bovifimosum TaxID=126998 RepID=A0A9W9L9S0_9EURO|nr:uncharacterized protein N7515_000283 [Penicillium bovifimosum]KAJ5145719.1 hypothetical protein N7515_000283 [Penicillium bovifimosum]